ncbi:MAG: hypothetical protein ACE5HA_08595 [Anaerolineae bacterium]
MYLAETDQVAIYIGLSQALFVFPSTQSCPRCGRPARLFRHRNGHSECIGCNGPDSAEDYDDPDVALPYFGE